MKRALVTGASSGIGREFALRLGKSGYLVTAVARDKDQLIELLAVLGKGHRLMVADLSKMAGINLVAKELKAEHYQLLVNDAGFAVQGRFPDTSLERQLEMVDVNVRALVSLAHTFLGKARIGDALINLSSVLAFLPMPSIGLYAATKALVSSFSESLWYEQKASGVYVMGLCPGMTDTNFYRVAGGGELKAPEALIQTPAQVVEIALRALKARRSPTVICGSLNALMVYSTRVRTRKSVVKQMGRLEP
jgi:short-subunit dehydrogenase